MINRTISMISPVSADNYGNVCMAQACELIGMVKIAFGLKHTVMEHVSTLDDLEALFLLSRQTRMLQWNIRDGNVPDHVRKHLYRSIQSQKHGGRSEK